MLPAIVIPNWIEEQRQRLAKLAAQFASDSPSASENHWRVSQENLSIQWNQLLSGLQRICTNLLEVEDTQDQCEQVWELICQLLRMAVEWHFDAQRALTDKRVAELSAEIQAYYRELDRVSLESIESCSELVRFLVVSKPNWNLTLPDDLVPIVWTVRISPLAYLRTMWNLFWAVIRHPLSETTIDLSTGRVLYRI